MKGSSSSFVDTLKRSNSSSSSSSSTVFPSCTAGMLPVLRLQVLLLLLAVRVPVLPFHRHLTAAAQQHLHQQRQQLLRQQLQQQQVLLLRVLRLL